MTIVNRKDLLGKRFGKLTVTDFAWVDNTNAHWFCTCDCGNSRVVSRPNLIAGHTVSCGCAKGKHHMYQSPEYRTWSSMIQRCTNPKSIGYNNYGGRGIAVCASWFNFENFYADMGNRPYGLSLERMNNEGNYSKHNCFWATRSQQNRNKRTNKMLTVFGRTQCVADWAAECGLHRSVLGSRLRMGWTARKALSTPLVDKKAKRGKRS